MSRTRMTTLTELNKDSISHPSGACFHILVCKCDINFLCIVFIFRFAEAVRDGSCYFVLLIITDGVITDLPQTKQAIVHVSVDRYELHIEPTSVV